jgi:hypothetical protein
MEELRLTRWDTQALPNARQLMHPIEPTALASTTAYIVGEQACRALYDNILPIKYGPDSWGAFVREGWIRRIRCVFPQPVSEELDFKSSIDYFSEHSLVARFSEWSARHRVPIISHVAASRRRRRERETSRTAITDEQLVDPHG